MWNQVVEGDFQQDKPMFGNIMDFLRNLNVKSIQKNTDKVDIINSSPGEHTTIVVKEDSPDRTTFQDVPISCRLQILSYLDVASLCRAAQVCSQWMELTEDTVLWEKKLQNDSYKWQVIDHLTHPENYRRTCPDLSAKEIYIKCCPQYRIQRSHVNSPLQFSKLRNYLGFSAIPRIVMFGSGMDTSGIVGRILMDQCSPFTVNGMFPGQYDGIGSGVSLLHEDRTINLITLYALSKAERENMDSIVKRSKLVVEEDFESEKLTLSQPVKQLCATINSFIYIVDGSDDKKVTYRMEEFKAMIDDRWLQQNARILVLCIVPNATVKSVSSIEVANRLDLVNLSRPWQVRQCHVSNLYGLLPGIKWVTAHV